MGFIKLFLFFVFALFFLSLSFSALDGNDEREVVIDKHVVERFPPERRAYLVPKSKNEMKKTKAQNANNSAYMKKCQTLVADRNMKIKELEQQVQLKDGEIERLKREKDEEIERLKREKNEEIERWKQMARFECPVCAENVSATHVLYCGHKICKKCGDKIM